MSTTELTAWSMVDGWSTELAGGGEGSFAAVDSTVSWTPVAASAESATRSEAKDRDSDSAPARQPALQRSLGCGSSERISQCPDNTDWNACKPNTPPAKSACWRCCASHTKAVLERCFRCERAREGPSSPTRASFAWLSVMVESDIAACRNGGLICDTCNYTID